MTKPQLRQHTHFVRMYREFQVLHKQFRYSFQYFFLPPHKCMVMQIAILGIYGAIRIQGPRSITMGVGAMMAMIHLTILFRRMGKVYEKSVYVLRSWRAERGKYIRRFVRSSQPVTIRIGHFYEVTKSTVIVIWATVFNFTTNLLLSF